MTSSKPAWKPKKASLETGVWPMTAPKTEVNENWENIMCYRRVSKENWAEVGNWRVDGS